MATRQGKHSTHLTQLAGEYLVASELCRQGFVATTFTGNVPHYDIIASDNRGQHVLVQVKAIRKGSWQFDLRKFVEITLDGQRQVLGKPLSIPYDDLVCVLVELRGHGRDRFFILQWNRLRDLVISAHRRYLEKHGGVRPRKPGSFHTAIRPSDVAEFEGKWELITKRLAPASNERMGLTARRVPQPGK